MANDLLGYENTSNLMTNLLQDGQTLIRKKLIYSAVNFLNNPRLQITSSDEKKMFLLKKGLTQDEIDLVFQLCITRPGTDAALKNELDQLTFLTANSSLLTSSTFLGKLFNLAFCLTVIGTFAYGSYALYQTKIRPYFDKSLRRKDSHEEICDNINALNSQIIELNKNVAIVHEFVRTYCRTRDDSMISLKNELSSIKSLLVNRSQFPSVPTIPKWQLDNPKKTLLTPTATNGHYSNNASDSGDSSKSD